MSNRGAEVMTLEDYEKLKEKYSKITNRADYEISAYMKAKCSKKPDVKLIWDDLNNDERLKNKSRKVDGKYYVITLYVHLFHLFEVYLRNHHYSQEEIDTILSYVVSYVYYHEYFHILFGHCSILTSVEGNLDTLTKKQMEYACDMKAIDTMFVDAEVVYSQTGDLTSYEETYGTFLSSLFLYFKFYEEKELHSMKNNIGTEKYETFTDDRRTHPFITFRFEYLRSLIDWHIEKRCKGRGENSKVILSDIYSKFDDLLCKYGNFERLKVNPWEYENAAEIDRIREIDFDKINSLCSDIFIDDLK